MRPRARVIAARSCSSTTACSSASMVVTRVLPGTAGTSTPPDARCPALSTVTRSSPGWPRRASSCTSSSPACPRAGAPSSCGSAAMSSAVTTPTWPSAWAASVPPGYCRTGTRSIAMAGNPAGSAITCPAASMPTSRATTGSAPGAPFQQFGCLWAPGVPQFCRRAARSSASTPSRAARRSSTAAPSSSSRRSSRRSTDTSRLIRLAARARPCWSRTMPRAAGITSSRTRLSSAAARACSASTTCRLKARAASVPTRDITRTARISRRAWTRSVILPLLPHPSRQSPPMRAGPGPVVPAGRPGHEQQRERGQDQRPRRARNGRAEDPGIHRRPREPQDRRPGQHDRARGDREQEHRRERPRLVGLGDPPQRGAGQGQDEHPPAERAGGRRDQVEDQPRPRAGQPAGERPARDGQGEHGDDDEVGDRPWGGQEAHEADLHEHEGHEDHGEQHQGAARPRRGGHDPAPCRGRARRPGPGWSRRPPG